MKVRLFRLRGFTVLAALLLIASLLPVTSVGSSLGAALASASDNSAPAPSGFRDITDTDRGRAFASQASEKARQKGHERSAAALQVFESVEELPGGRMTVASDRGLEVAGVSATEDADRGINYQLSIAPDGQGNSEGPAEQQEFNAAAAFANHSCSGHYCHKNSTREGDGVNDAVCGFVYFKTNVLDGSNCYEVVYEGYANQYYYFSVIQEAQIRSIHGDYRLTDLDIRGDDYWAVSWAGVDAKEPATTVTKSCQTNTFTVSAAGFSHQISPKVCETWTPHYSDSDPGTMALDWSGNAGAWSFRELQYLLLVRKYRCKCWKYTFQVAAYASYAP